jgi:type 1 glutamine amidotransferase/HEAT repeat protein
MIGAAALRNLAAAIPSLLAGTRDADAGVRIASAQALGKIGRAEDYGSLVNALLDATDSATRDAMSAAVAAVGKRVNDPQAKIAPLLAALKSDKISSDAVAIVVRTLAGVGGADALAAVNERINSPNATIGDAAIRALADWPDGAALTNLQHLVNNSSNAVQKAIALRGLLRLAPMEKNLGACWLADIREALKTSDEKRQMLGALSSVHNSDAMIIAKNMLSDADVKVEASAALIQIGGALLKADPSYVDDAMTQVLAAIPDSADAKSLQSQARKLLKTKSESSRSRRDEIAKSLQAGCRQLTYLDCGVESEDKSADGVRMWVAHGVDYDWSTKGGDGDAAALTVAFSGGQVVIGASGLDAKKSYGVGFTWWDYDDNKREESVWVSGKQIVARTALPSWKGKQQKPETLTRAIPADAIREGKIEIAFKQEGAGNSVVSEIWLLEGTITNPQPVAAAEAKPLFSGRTNPGAAKKALIVTGMEYPGHKWRETVPLLRETISEDKRIGVEINEDAKAALESPSLGGNDVIVMNYMNWQNPGPGDAAQEGLRKAVANGTGLVLVHFACGAFQTWPEFVKIAGRIWNPKFRGHDPYGPFQIHIADSAHEITKGVSNFNTTDELYTCLDGDTPIHVLADANSKGDHKDYPMAFVLQYGKGRVFLSTLGHDVKALSVPDVKNLYRRATAWAAGLPPER